MWIRINTALQERSPAVIQRDMPSTKGSGVFILLLYSFARSFSFPIYHVRVRLTGSSYRLVVGMKKTSDVKVLKHL